MFKVFTYCKHLLSTTILLTTASSLKNSIVWDFSGDISIPKILAVFCNVKQPKLF